MPKDLPTLSLSSFVAQNRTRIGLALSLVVIENVAWIAEPTVFGDVLDAYIDKGLAWSSAGFVGPLSLWIGLFLTNSGVGALRRIIDPRIYLRIYSRMAVEVAQVGISRNQGTSISPSTTSRPGAFSRSSRISGPSSGRRNIFPS